MVEPSSALERAKILILDAVDQGDVSSCVSIITHGFPVDSPVVDTDVTLLMLVSAVGTADQLQMILDLDPEVNQRDKIGRTALHHSCSAGNLNTFKGLVEVDDVDIDVTTNAGFTPLMMAVNSEKIQLVAECLNCNLNPFLKDGTGRTALDYAQ